MKETKVPNMYLQKDTETAEMMVNYAKEQNEKQLVEKFVEKLKNKKPMLAVLNEHGVMLNTSTQEQSIITEAYIFDVNFCKDCPHGLVGDAYVFCRRDKRRMGLLDFCSLSTVEDLPTSEWQYLEKGE